MNVTKVVRHVLNEFPVSKEVTLLLPGCIGLAKEIGYSWGNNLDPVALVAKEVAGVFTAIKTLQDFDTCAHSIQACYSKPLLKEKVVSTIQDGAKCVGDVCGLLKLLGTIGGVAALAPRAQFFGSIKTALTFPLLTYAIMSDVKSLKDKKAMALLGIISSLSIIWFDTVATFNPWKRVRPVPQWSIHLALLSAGTANVIKSILKNCQEEGLPS